MTLEITTDNSILLDGKNIGFKVQQTFKKTLVYHPATPDESDYEQITMPHDRYALSCDNPDSGIPGAAQFEADLKEILKNA